MAGSMMGRMQQRVGCWKMDGAGIRRTETGYGCMQWRNVWRVPRRREVKGSGKRRMPTSLPIVSPGSLGEMLSNVGGDALVPGIPVQMMVLSMVSMMVGMMVKGGQGEVLKMWGERGVPDDYAADGASNNNFSIEIEQEEENFGEKPLKSVDEVWSKAWQPLRDESIGNGDGGTGTPSSSAPLVSGGREEGLWVECVESMERRQLLKLCMDGLQREVSMLSQGWSLSGLTQSSELHSDGSSNVDSQTVEERECFGLLKRVACTAAMEWLGYVPKDVLNMKVDEDDSGERWVGLYCFQEKKQVYMNVLRLLTASFELMADEQDDTMVTPEKLQSCNIELVDGDSCRMLRSWQISPKTVHQYHSVLAMAAPWVLQDMVVSIADVIVAAYLKDVVDGKPSVPCTSGEGKGQDTVESLSLLDETRWPHHRLLELSLWPSLLQESLESTRSIQKFSNKVIMSRLLNQYIFHVIHIYEDVLPLYTIVAGTDGITYIQGRNMPLRRSKELNQLKGIQFFVCLCLEGFDICYPLGRRAWKVLSGIITWVLTRGIGQALGLVWKGIKNASSSKFA